MKTRRNHGSKQRMTVTSSVISTHDASGRKDQATLDATDCSLSKDSTVLHETRSQKLARVNVQQDDHAETKEPTPHQTELPSSNLRVSTRSSTRPQKRQRKSLSSPASNVQQDAPTTGPSRVKKKLAGKKRKRQWESWSLEDKNAFFDALHEHGKDFDKIQVILQTRHKRRGDPKNLIKNKDQVRHFYYRTLNKISKYVPKDKQFTTETDPHQKTVLELRSLTCFGELRKRVGGLGEKQGKKLHELLEYGWTTIRQSGRNARLKAPTCRALKRLTLSDTLGKCDESSTLPPPVPSKLDVEFLPIDNATWLAVQGLSKNPRLKTTVSSKKPLSLIITFLAKKWPVKSFKPNTNEFLALCIAVPVEFLLTQHDEQNEGLCSDIVKDINKNTTVNNRSEHKESPMENDSQNSTSPSQGTTVNNASNSVSKDGTNVAGSTNNSTNDRTLWTSTNCGNITIGDIYCKLQRPPKLKFEYMFQQDDTLPVMHGQNALQKLVNIAKTEFYSTKKGATANKAASNNADSTKNSSSRTTTSKTGTAGRTLRIAPKASERFPFILPSIFQPAPRQMFNQSTAVNPSSSLRTTSSLSYISNRKRAKKNQQITKSPAVVQRKLLPHPVNDMPRGAVAVSFIPQPVQSVSPEPSPDFDSAVPTPEASPKQVPSRSETTATVLADSPTPASPLTPATSPCSSSNVITTVLETGVRPHPVANHPVSSQENTSTGLNDMPCMSNPVVSLPEVDHLIDTLQNFTPTTGSTGIDNDIGTVGTSLHLDPSVTINDDSGSELLASIIGLNTFPTSNAQTAVLPSSSSDSQSVKSSTEELTSGIASCSAVSFPVTSSFIDILSALNTGTVSSAATSTASTPSLFLNSVSENSNDGFAMNNHEKACMSPTRVNTALFASPQSSPVGITSPTTDHQWFNGEVSDISLSFFDKLGVSPEKEPKFGYDVPSVPLFSVGKDPVSQDSLFGGKAVFETAQAERALRAIMDENSVDLVKKFQDLTKQFSNEDKTSAAGGESSSDSCGSGVLSFKNLIGKSENSSD